ncbi:oligosaccharide flippase family protein [Candidatus Daviesbacteria bacterium]|nr:oligosaccharide flippase family protein [Candidatus Daviesbacteria bacterium]
MLRKILSTQTWRHSQITILGTIINGVLGAIFYILMARFLGPADFGLLTVTIVTLTLISDIGDLGINTGLIRFVSSSLKTDKEKAFRFLKLSLEIKFLVWLLILISGFFLSPIVSSLIFGKPELIVPLRLAMIGVGGALLFSFATSALQSFQKFFLWSFVNISSNLLRLLIILFLSFSQQLNLFYGISTYIILPFFGFSLTLLFLPAKRILAVSNERSVAKEFFRFNKWVALFTFIAAISSRLDTFLNTRLLSVQDIGIYGAANQLTQIIPQVVGALGVVAAPKFASFQDNKQMLNYFKKFQFLVLGLSLLISLAIPLSFFALPFLYGSKYLQSVTPFIILLVAMLVFLISVPLHNCIIFYFGRSDIFVWISIIHLFIIGVLGYLMITNYGVIGTALTVLVGMIANFLLPLFWFIKLNKEKVKK